MKRICLKKVLLLVMASFVLFSCEKKNSHHSGDGNYSNLDFSTTREVQLVINYDIPDGYAASFHLYNENPIAETAEGDSWILREDINPISGGIVISGSYNLKKTLPAYANELYIYSPDIFTPTLMKATVTNGIAEFSIVDITSNNLKNNPLKYNFYNPDAYLLYDGGAAFITNYPNPKNSPLELPGGIGPNHLPRIAYHNEVSTDILTRISLALPEKQEVDPAFLSNNAIYLKEEAEVFMSILTSNSTVYKNALDYFFFEGTKEELMAIPRDKIEKTDVIAIPFAHLQNANSNSRLKCGDYVQLYYYNETTGEWSTKFPANVTIGFGLRTNAYDIDNVNLNSGWQFSHFSLNTMNEAQRHHASMLNAGTKADKFIVFGFEDAQNLTYSDRDYNDVMFHMMVSPSSAIDDDNIPVIPSEDPEIIVETERNGILAFEDLWPARGDYDLNDVVVSYSSNATLTYNDNDKQTYLTKLEDTFSLLHSGASYHNKFGLKIDVNPALIESITINGEAYTPKTDSYKGITGIILDLCDDVLSVIDPFVENEPYDYNIVITFREGITEAEFERIGAPYNPFITTPEEGVEVHVSRYYPTSRANLSKFGTIDDMSDVNADVYYVSGSSNKYPFAIHLSGVRSFRIPEEAKTIDKTYPRFINWVESGCTEYTDWYLN